MKITLDSKELNQAVLEYLESQGLTVDTDKASVEITSEGVKIDTNPTDTKPTKDKDKTKTKDDSKDTKAKKEETPKQVNETKPETPTTVSFEEDEEDTTNLVITDTTSDSKDKNLFAFKQSSTSEVRKLFA